MTASDPAWKGWMRRVVPRPLRTGLRRPGVTARWLEAEARAWLGRTVACPMRPDWTIRSHPVSAPAFRGEAADPDQAAELAGFVARCRPGMVLFDVGASYGAFTLAAVRYGGPTARVVAVDPSATSNRILRANVRLAGAGAQVDLIEGAVGASDGELAMLTTGPAGEHYLVASAGARPDAVRIPQYTLASLAARAGVEPTHLKVDVEGFEAEVLRGGRELLLRCRPELFLEWHPGFIRDRGGDPLAVFAALDAAGYRRFEVAGRPIDPAAEAGAAIVRLVALPGEA